MRWFSLSLDLHLLIIEMVAPPKSVNFTNNQTHCYEFPVRMSVLYTFNKHLPSQIIFSKFKYKCIHNVHDLHTMLEYCANIVIANWLYNVPILM